MNDDSVQLTDLVRLLVEHSFAAEEQAEAFFMLSQLDGHTKQSPERIQIAVIRGSNGSLNELASCIDMANGDFRDLLMATDFGHDINAHLKWADEVLSRSK